MESVAHITSEEQYPIVETHLESARREISRSPARKGSIQLNEFLETKLSKEPQVGFIIGVGANEVTGAVSTSAPNAAQLDMAVQMIKQSAQEALTMVKNYIQELSPNISIPWLFGNLLQHYTIHHQLLSASYNVGGPSAGFALALNTMSALLRIPLCIDFGITGAPLDQGVRKEEVGGSVIIGGHRKKNGKSIALPEAHVYAPCRTIRTWSRSS